MRRYKATRSFPHWAIVALLILLAPTPGGAEEGQAPSSSVRPPAGAAAPARPGDDAEMWKKVREGVAGKVSIPDKKAAQLVQSDGEAWRNFRNGPLVRYGAWAIGGMLALLCAFYLIRGRIAIEEGFAGRTLARFGEWERFAHWLLALSFITLAVTGLNILYGRYLLLPLIGADAFSLIARWGKLLHDYVAFAFIIALLLVAIQWIPQNLASWRDIVWLAKGGGIFGRAHPPAWKFNAGQKILFWLVMLGGLSLSLSGLALLFPFQVPLFAKTFHLLDMAGLKLPTTLTPLQEMQYASSWHSILALALIAVIIAHIYIGTLGMQGAFSAMANGRVDVNWAKEHHSLWAEQELKRMESAAAAETDAARLAAEPR